MPSACKSTTAVRKSVATCTTWKTSPVPKGVASGCCVGGLSLSPAAGRALADLIVDGASDPDLAPLSVERFRHWTDPARIEEASVHHYARKYLK